MLRKHRDILALCVGIFSFICSAALLAVFYTALCCIFRDIDFTESVVGGFMYHQAALLEYVARLPVNLLLLLLGVIPWLLLLCLRSLGALVSGLQVVLHYFFDCFPHSLSLPPSLYASWKIVLLHGVCWAMITFLWLLYAFDFGSRESYGRLGIFMRALKLRLQREERQRPSRFWIPVEGDRKQIWHPWLTAAYKAVASLMACGIQKEDDLSADSAKARCARDEKILKQKDGMHHDACGRWNLGHSSSLLHSPDATCQQDSSAELPEASEDTPARVGCRVAHGGRRTEGAYAHACCRRSFQQKQALDLRCSDRAPRQLPEASLLSGKQAGMRACKGREAEARGDEQFVYDPRGISHGGSCLTRPAEDIVPEIESISSGEESEWCMVSKEVQEAPQRSRLEA
ncbi:hypothetical protein cyc_00582 [Cyclospora cayetanensis]|uniref:Transmembrane protein n=1 Tax=Cyclospora cayetanensis TaxID=88456 RepID=A0A1D3CYQ0_9EIME|nr:hypothetical protein cyc_00582 [Cyclospora cayetanensis]